MPAATTPTSGRLNPPDVTPGMVIPRACAFCEFSPFCTRLMYPFDCSAFRWHITPLGDEMPNSVQMSRIAGGKPFSSMCLRMYV